MNDHQLRELLNERSPWRARGDWEREDPDLRAAADVALSYRPAPLEGIAPPGLYVLRGPRRVGKSLELKRCVAGLIGAGVDPKLIFYCACDGLSKQDLRRLVAQGENVTRTLSGARYWLLDEVTSVAGWSQTIKELRDQSTGFREACVVLTGSSARDLETARKDLADRRGGIADSERLLLPMGFRAFCRALGDHSELPDTVLAPRDFLGSAAERALWALEPSSARLSSAWELFLDVGGFPRAVGEFVATGAVGDGFLQGLWDVIAGEAVRAVRMSELEVAALLDRLVANLCSPLNMSKIAGDLGLSGHQAAADRVSDLVLALLAWGCHRVRDGQPNLRAQRKLYFVDPLLALLVHRRNPARAAPDRSKLHEQQLGLTLTRAASDRAGAVGAFVHGDRALYERTPTGAEIDFVGPALGVAFECKYTDSGWRRDAQTLRARHGGGVVLTRSQLVLDRDSAVWAVPGAIAAWLLGV
jgi:hypothetical protein